MDTSKEYISMCEKAVEIQTIWQKPTLNMLPVFIYDTHMERVCNVIWTPKTIAAQLQGGGQVLVVSIEFWDDRLYYDTERSLIDGTVWLPRQDQLQAMIWGNDGFSMPCAEMKLLFDAIHTAKNKQAGYYHDLTSMEQLWLAFVMKEKYNKTWTGNDWA